VDRGKRNEEETRKYEYIGRNTSLMITVMPWNLEATSLEAAAVTS